MTIPAGTKLDRYEIRSQLGAGGMGEVYLAQDTKLDRKVALKILPAELAANRDRMRRFQQEAKAAAALNHPNIAHVYEIGEHKGLHFISMEYVEGRTLRDLILYGRTELVKLLKYLQQVAGGLAKAHAAGIVHRDLKPDNIMIARDGYPKILDFGLAKLVEISGSTIASETASDVATVAIEEHSTPGRLIGTIGYMSPEQAQGKPGIDHRSDIFSFGCILFEVVTRRRPFQGESKVQSLYRLVYEPAPPLTDFNPTAGPELQRIVRRCLAKDPDERYQSIQDVALELKELRREAVGDTQLEGISTAASQTAISDVRQTSSSAPVTSEIKIHKKAGLVIAALVLLIIVGGIFFFRSRNAPVLTEKDTVLLADYANTTADPVFDGTLKQALAVQLGQSPFLSILSEDRVRGTLRLMGRSPDERITREIGREICQRLGLKAMLVGSIASLGGQYVITLEAINAQTGDAIAGEQAEAQSKEQVLQALGQAATKLRERLGESLQSIQKFDAPIEQATTSSLEAFQAFSLGVEQQLQGKYVGAIPFLKRAIALDPNFALAHARMASMYYNTAQDDLAAEASKKAFELRDRVSERERLYITQAYYDNVTGELEQYLETLELWKRTYPRDASPPNNLAVKYNEFGLFDKAAAEAREAIRLSPGSASGYSLLAAALLGLGRLDEAKQTIHQAQVQNLDTVAMRRTLYRLAFIQRDEAMMQQQLDWLKGKPNQYLAQGWQSETAAFLGQLQRSQQFSDGAFESAQQRNQKDVAAQIAIAAAGRDSLFGICAQVKEHIAKALSLTSAHATRAHAGNALARCGESTQAQAIIAGLTRQSPTDTVLNKILVPLAQARIELQRANAAQAVQLLETTRPYEGYALFQIAYLRAEAYLIQQKGAEAAAEFQKILDHRGSQPTSPIFPLAHLGLARAAQLNGDSARARQAYEDFFALWKDADPNIPVLQDARQHYATLK